MDILCASQAATAICLNMEQLASSSSPSSPSSSAILLGSRSRSPAIDRYNPIITDSRRLLAKPPPLPPSQPHNFIPKPHKNHYKKKSTKKVPCKESSDHGKKNDDDEKVKVGNSRDGVMSKSNGRKSWSCTRPRVFISPPGSTRYLLSDEKVLVNRLSDSDPSPELFLAETSEAAEEIESNCKPKHSCSPSSASQDQVVVLRVSLHCRGCERKMRKHISRMEGVTSFNIDFAAKKVTVSGNITPLEVLSSISKVKNAQLWSPANQTTY